jgi:hypothetical protein
VTGPSEKRRLKEADIDPSGEVTHDTTGETEDVVSGRDQNNQPSENRENPTRGERSGTPDRDSETLPKRGDQE